MRKLISFYATAVVVAVILLSTATEAFSTRQILLGKRLSNLPSLEMSSDDGGYDETLNEAAEMMASQQQEQQIPPQTSPPVPPKRLDPLMASLTRTDPSTADVPTRNIPLLGEIPVDGSLALLIPAAGIAVIGLLLSVYIAVNSSDEIVGLLTQVSSDISNQASQQANQQYDPNVCRGICSGSNDGLKTFMEGLRK